MLWTLLLPLQLHLPPVPTLSKTPPTLPKTLQMTLPMTLILMQMSVHAFPRRARLLCVRLHHAREYTQARLNMIMCLNSDFKPQADEAAMSEVRILQFFRHVNIIRLHRSFQSRGHLHLVFEYAEQTLQQKLTSECKGKGLPLSTGKSIIYQLLCALSHMHRSVPLIFVYQVISSIWMYFPCWITLRNGQSARIHPLWKHSLPPTYTQPHFRFLFSGRSNECMWLWHIASLVLPKMKLKAVPTGFDLLSSALTLPKLYSPSPAPTWNVISGQSYCDSILSGLMTEDLNLFCVQVFGKYSPI